MELNFTILRSHGTIFGPNGKFGNDMGPFCSHYLPFWGTIGGFEALGRKGKAYDRTGQSLDN